MLRKSFLKHFKGGSQSVLDYILPEVKKKYKLMPLNNILSKVLQQPAKVYIIHRANDEIKMGKALF